MFTKTLKCNYSELINISSSKITMNKIILIYDNL